MTALRYVHFVSMRLRTLPFGHVTWGVRLKNITADCRTTLNPGWGPLDPLDLKTASFVSDIACSQLGGRDVGQLWSSRFSPWPGLHPELVCTMLDPLA